MKTKAQIQALKQISIIGFLRYRGMIPVKISGGEYWYLSLLRNENTASLSVNLSKNVFKDFGDDSSKGSIIDLVMMLDKISFIQACQILEDYDGKKEIEVMENSFSLSCQTSNSTTQDYQITAVKDLQHPALIRYVESRKISFQNAFKYLKEIHYTKPSGKFFGVGYQNEIGGYVVRNGIFKKPINLGNTGIKTFVIDGSKNVSIFEGMFDFLSCIEHYKRLPRCTAIILNSVINLSKAMPLLERAETIYSYLDNDDAGQKANQKMRDAGLNVSDQTKIYEGYKDFNEYLNK